MIKFSIIIPVYNAQNYLEDCLKSIKEQSYGNYEVIMIDDGSKDESGAICERFAATDERFNVIHTENSGVSAARNHGLDCVSGDYVKFVDADDILADGCLEELAAELIKKDWDMIEHSMYVFFSNGEIQHLEWYKENLTFDDDSKKLNAMGLLFSSYKLGSMCTKVINSKYFNGSVSKLRFREGMIFVEDQLMAAQLFDASEKVYFVNREYYGYRKGNNESATGKFNPQKRGDIKFLLKYLDGMIEKYFKNDERMLKAYSDRKLDNIVSDLSYLPYYVNCNSSEEKKYIKEYCKDEYFGSVFKDRKAGDGFKYKLFKWLMRFKCYNLVRLMLGLRKRIS